MSDYQTDLQHALYLADEADAITLKYYRSIDLQIATKLDKTPVTEGDLAVEKRLSNIVEEEFHESYLGEEGTRQSNGNRLWIVDPIDGTKNFMRRMPVWGTLIALTEDGETVAAVVSSPALGRRWWAAKGMGAWTRDPDGFERQIHVSKVSELSDAFFLTSTLFTWDTVPTGSDAVFELIKQIWRHRAVGDMFNYMLVAEGAADACAEPGIKQWDIEAPKLIVTEAGGSFWTSATPDMLASTPRTALATNGLLEAPIRKALKL